MTRRSARRPLIQSAGICFRLCRLNAEPATGRPTAWLVENEDLLPRGGDALDVACGRGRHALWLAEHGFTVRAVDRDAEAVDALREESTRRRLNVQAGVLDLETGTPWLGDAGYDVIVVVHYLHRPLFPWLIRALRPGGMLVYETFTRAQAARGKPSNPVFLLEPGELRRLVQPLRVVKDREGVFEDRDVASIIAVRATTPPFEEEAADGTQADR